MLLSPVLFNAMESNKDTCRNRHDFILIVAVCFVFWLLSICAGQLITMIPGLDLEEPMHLRCVLAVNQIVAMLIPSLTLNKLLARGTTRNNYIASIVKIPKPRHLLISFLTLLSLLPLVSLLVDWNGAIVTRCNWLSGIATSQDASIQDTYLTLFDISSLSDWIMCLLVTVIIAGISEELMFRGVFQNYLMRCGTSKIASVIMVALLFSVVHFQISEFLPRFAMGIILGYVYVLSNNIWVPVFMHCLNNMFALLAYHFKIGMPPSVSLFAFLALVIILVWHYGIRSYKNKQF